MTFIDEFVTDKNAEYDKNINGIITLNLDAQDHYYIPSKPIKVYCENFLTDKKKRMASRKKSKSIDSSESLKIMKSLYAAGLRFLKRNICSENLSPSAQADIPYYVENRIIKN